MDFYALEFAVLRRVIHSMVRFSDRHYPQAIDRGIAAIVNTLPKIAL